MALIYRFDEHAFYFPSKLFNVTTPQLVAMPILNPLSEAKDQTTYLWTLCWVLFFFFFLSFCLFRAALEAYGGSQARGLIGAVAASLRHSHSNARSELRLGPTPQLMETLDP